jgi:hypothetical protein
MAESVHVMPVKAGVWAVKREGNKRATGLFGSQLEATLRGREIAQTKRITLVIHGQDNRIIYRDNFGRDPYLPKDRKH